jgi:UTP--glucose-1-phosphate uridylyltransferase
MHNSIETLILPVAGRGSRLGLISEIMPKEWVPVYDRPALHWSIDEAVISGINTIIFVVGSETRANYIREYFGINSNDTCSRHTNRNVRMLFAMQPEPKGTGDSILCAQHLIDKNAAFSVLMPDDLILTNATNKPGLGQLLESFRACGTHCVSVEEVKPPETVRFGIVKPFDQSNTGDRTIRVESFVEKPPLGTAPSNLAVTARYAFLPDMWDSLEEIKILPAANGEIQLTDAISLHLSQGGGVHAYHIDGKRYDCGHPLGLLEASRAYAQYYADPACLLQHGLQ